ncbi:TPA: hypothetical protein ACTDM3_004585 [Salmonella enterica subsp. enterica]|nr:DUF2919 domain-containing protein [Salmonella enterica subsp. salamae]HAK5655353.1 DUF2919 domain-containing protein [Salmonella enterica]
MKSRPFYPDRYYDSRGELGAPYWFWLLLLWQSRAWWAVAFLMAGGTSAVAIADRGDALWWWQLLAGAPAIAMVFCYALRGHQNISRWSFALMVGGAGLLLLTMLYQWVVTPPPAQALWLSFVCFDAVLFLVLCGSRHLRNVFWTEKPYINGG